MASGVDPRSGRAYALPSSVQGTKERTRGMTMRNLCTGVIAGVAGVLFLSALATAQNNAQNNAPRSPWRYYPMDRATGDGGTAPQRDLTGTWAGPPSGRGAPRKKGEVPAPLTPRAKEL